MRRLLHFLAQPYPILDGPATQLRRAALIGAFVGGFLLIFQPFDLNRWSTPHKALKILGFGGVTFLVTAVHYGLWPRLTPAAFAEKRWTVGRAMAFLQANVLLIAGANVGYLNWLLGTPFEVQNLSWMLAATFLVGLFPTAATVTGTYVRQLRRYQQSLAALPAPAQPAPTPSAPPPALPSQLTLTPDNGRDSRTLPVAELLFIEAAGNYCTVVHAPLGQVPQRWLLRASLSRLAAQLTEQGFGETLTRVHRSYLVNLGRVTRVSGTAQGYRLHFAAVPDAEAVPVARAYNEVVTRVGRP